MLIREESYVEMHISPYYNINDCVKDRLCGIRDGW